MATFTRPKAPGTPTWVDLAAPDVDAARAFYHELFGWEYDIGGPEFGGYTTARVGSRSAAGLSAPPPGRDVPTAWGLYFASDDLAADAARAVELGATQLFPPMIVGDFGGMVGLVDPTGAPFSFWKAGTHIGWQIAGEHGSAAWHELYTTDAKRARDFYTALLGATAEVMEGGMEYYVLSHGSEQLAGIMQIDPSWGAMKPEWVTYFAVDDTDAAAAIFTKHGGQVMGPIEDTPFGRMAAVRDPSGANLKIIKPPR